MRGTPFVPFAASRLAGYGNPCCVLWGLRLHLGNLPISYVPLSHSLSDSSYGIGSQKIPNQGS